MRVLVLAASLALGVSCGGGAAAPSTIAGSWFHQGDDGSMSLQLRGTTDDVTGEGKVSPNLPFGVTGNDKMLQFHNPDGSILTFNSVYISDGVLFVLFDDTPSSAGFVFVRQSP
jgi:hypothetical protein